MRRTSLSLPDNFPTRHESSRPGRPPKIVRQPEIVETLLEAVEEGEPLTIAVKRAGIARKTLYDYLKKGRKAMAMRERSGDPDAQLTQWDDAYIYLAREIEKREADQQKALLDKIEEDDSWQSKAWMLERIWPEDWSKDTTIRHVGSDGGPIEFTLSVGEKPDTENTMSLEEASQEYDVLPPDYDDTEADYEIVEEDE